MASWTDEALQPFGIDVSGAAEGFVESHIQEDILEPVMQKNFKAATGDWNFFKPENLSGTNVSLVNAEKYLQIDVEYNLDITFPFFEKTIALEKTSYERLWTGGS